MIACASFEVGVKFYPTNQFSDPSAKSSRLNIVLSCCKKYYVGATQGGSCWAAPNNSGQQQ